MNYTTGLNKFLKNKKDDNFLVIYKLSIGN